MLAGTEWNDRPQGRTSAGIKFSARLRGLRTTPWAGRRPQRYPPESPTGRTEHCIDIQTSKVYPQIAKGLR